MFSYCLGELGQSAEVSAFNPDHHWKVNNIAARSRSLNFVTCAQMTERSKEKRSLSPLFPFPADVCLMLPRQSLHQPSIQTLNILRFSKMDLGKLKFPSDAVFFFLHSFSPVTPALNGRLWGSSSSFPSINKEELDEDVPPHFILLHCLITKRVSWGSRQYWLSWWRCHQSQIGGLGKCHGSERQGPWEGLGGNWEAPPIMFLSMLSQSALSVGASHPGGILVWEPAPPYQEGWPKRGRNRKTFWLEHLLHGSNPVWLSMEDQESPVRLH